MGKGPYTDGITVTVRVDPRLVKRANVTTVNRGASLQTLLEQRLRRPLEVTT